MNSNGFRILVIDDDEDDYVYIRDLFEEMPGNNYKIIWKASYREGLEALLQGQYDACLLDQRLGEHTGLDLLREAQRLDLVCPIILLTGQGDFELDLQAMQIGAAEYLVKGQFTAPLLERSIRYAMKHALDMEGLREREENFRTLFNSTFEGIIVHHKGIIHDANVAAEKIFGYLPSEMIERSLLDFVHPSHKQLMQENLLSESEVRFEVTGLKKDGAEIHIELSNRIVSLRGRLQSLVAIRDLTERKQMEAQILQQDRLASLGLLASSLAHEIGTPLGIIRSRAELAMRKAGENVSLREDMDTVITQIDRITKLVNSLLHLARGNKSEFASVVNLSSVIQDVLNFINHELERKNIILETRIADDCIVKAEAGPLSQVLLNLFINAVQAIEEAKKKGRTGDHRITLQADNKENSVEIAIQDTGCGISEKNRAQLFKPFFTTKDIGSGTGLGLATSYKIVQSWGGSILVKSINHHGACFTVSLPRFSS